ncbi:methyltransferase domain-containing protein [candidate division GN15 bacterium]|nr:methyltransferase domain-containing protein [candidate division GN15 bacterium]
MNLYHLLEEITTRPEPFSCYTAEALWTNEHTSRQMLAYHLNGDVDISSRRTEFIDRSVDWIVDFFNVGAETAIADFGCGPGLYTSRLARHGAQVTGIDFSERSLDYAGETAAREGLAIDYVRGNYLSLAIDRRFDLILMIMCDYCALSPVQRRSLLHKFRELLNPGGAVLLDVYSLAAIESREETSVFAGNLLDGFWSPNPYFGFLTTFVYPAEKVVLDKYTIIEAERTRVIYNWLQYFSQTSIAEEFTRAGFLVDAVFSDVAGTPITSDSLEFAVVARRA